jgi:hypothetical protein
MVTHPENGTRRPVLHVIRGDATPEEIAALVAVVLARSVGSGAPEHPHRAAQSGRSAWSDRSRLLRGSLQAGPGAWRRSALPR